MKHICENCGKEHNVKRADIARGWGKTCSKSCAASLREKSKPGYDPKRVEENNVRREMWNYNTTLGDDLGDYDPGDSEYWDGKDY